MNSIPQSKKQQLQRHKLMATGLFVLMVVIYTACVYWQQYHINIVAGYIKAFAEAAMVGALADWFAVTALFHHPLGIPIPHTNLIENSKKRIGDNLGEFVVTNFLNPGTIRPYMHRLEISAYVAGWLQKEKNRQLLIAEMARLLKDILRKTDDEKVSAFITGKAKILLNEAKLNRIVAGGLKLIAERGDVHRILDYVIGKVKQYVAENEDMVRNRVKEESHFLIPGFVDNLIAAKLTKGIIKYLDEIEKDPQHNIRKDIDRQVQAFIQDMIANPKWEQELKNIKDGLLTGDTIRSYATAAWRMIQENLYQELDTPGSAVLLYFHAAINDVATTLQQDEAVRHKIDSWLRVNAYKMVLRNKDRVGALISDTVGDWEGKELSNKLELEIGKDLQFIRINGTVVGGLVGLIIYTLTHLLS